MVSDLGDLNCIAAIGSGSSKDCVAVMSSGSMTTYAVDLVANANIDDFGCDVNSVMGSPVLGNITFVLPERKLNE